jgi:hypothetical protein
VPAPLLLRTPAGKEERSEGRARKKGKGRKKGKEERKEERKVGKQGTTAGR